MNREPEPLTPEATEHSIRAILASRGGLRDDEPIWTDRAVRALLSLLDAARSAATPPPDGLRDALTEWAAWFNEVLAANAEMPEDEWSSKRANAAGEGLWAANRGLFDALAAATPPAAPDGLPTVDEANVERIRAAIHEHVGDDYPLLSLLVDLEAALRGGQSNG